MIIRRIMDEGMSDRYRDGEFSKDYMVLNELGRGRFAVVRRCEHRATKQHFAAKFIRKRKLGRDCKEDIMKEIKILEMSTDHPRLIGLHEVYETATDVILVLEFAIGGELHPYCVAEKDGSFTERDAVRLLFQIVEGVKYLHDQNIVHLDLKPQNILLTNEEIRQGDIKLIDFGIAKWLNKEIEVREIVGTVDYVAPEVLNFEPISLATDMWSVGVVAYVMFTGISPFAGETKQETYLNISQVNLDFPEEYFKDVSAEAQDFIRSLCVFEPEQRLTAADCISHPIFKKHLRDGGQLSIERVPCREDATMIENESGLQVLDLNNSLNNGFSRLMGSHQQLPEEHSSIEDKTLSDDNSNKLILSSDRTPDHLSRDGPKSTQQLFDSALWSSPERRTEEAESGNENQVMQIESTSSAQETQVKEQRTFTSSLSSKASLKTSDRTGVVLNGESGTSIKKESELPRAKEDKEQQHRELFTFGGPNVKVIGSPGDKLLGYHKGDTHFSPSSSPSTQRRVLHHGKENLISDNTPEPKRCKMEL